MKCSERGKGVFDKSNQPIPNLISCDITSYYVSEVVSLHITFQEKKKKWEASNMKAVHLLISE